MTYEPDREGRAPNAINPHAVIRERERKDMRAVLLLALIAAFILTGLWFYAKVDDETVATDRPAIEQTTTGAGTREAPLPSTPTPPTVPSPQQSPAPQQQ